LKKDCKKLKMNPKTLNAFKVFKAEFQVLRSEKLDFNL